MLRHLSRFGERRSVTRQARLQGIAFLYWDNPAPLDRCICIVREGKLLAALQRGTWAIHAQRIAGGVVTCPPFGESLDTPQNELATLSESP